MTEILRVFGILGLLLVGGVMLVILSLMAAWLTSDHKPLGAGRRRNDEVTTAHGYGGGESYTIEPTAGQVQSQLREAVADAKQRLENLSEESLFGGQAYYTHNGITPNAATHDIAMAQIALANHVAQFGEIGAPVDYSQWERINGVWQAPEDDKER